MGYAAALAAALLFGGTNAALKVALASADVLAASAVTFAVAGLVFLPLLLRTRPARRDLPLFLLSATVGGALPAYAVVGGIARIPASTASLLLAAEMVFTALFAWIAFRERPSAVEVPGLLLLASAAVVAGAGGGLAATGDLAGVGLVLLATVCWGVDNNVNAVLARRYDVRLLVAMRAGVGGGILVLAALVTGRSFDMPARAWGLLVAIGLLGIGLSTMVYYLALRHVGPTRAVVVFSTAGIWGALAGFVVLGEDLGWHHAVAGALLLSGLTWLAKAGAKPPAPGPA